MRKALFYVFSICAKEKKKFLLKLDFVLLIDPEVEQKNSGVGPLLETRVVTLTSIMMHLLKGYFPSTRP